MEFIPLASSSKGNCYLLKHEGVAPLLLEAGLPVKEIRTRLLDKGVMLSDLAGCLVSHEHGDHSKGVKGLLKAGVECAMSFGTAEALGIEKHHRTNVVPIECWRAGNPWRFFLFNLDHDASYPTGFVINPYLGDEKEFFLFIPDTAYVKSRFSGITQIFVECNYLEEKLHENIVNGSLPESIGRRVRKNHMSLETLIDMLKANDLSKCRKIYLLHLSDGNSDERKMKEEVQKATGIPVEVCEK